MNKIGTYLPAFVKEILETARIRPRAGVIAGDSAGQA
jgi:hypothetical protein